MYYSHHKIEILGFEQSWMRDVAPTLP